MRANGLFIFLGVIAMAVSAGAQSADVYEAAHSGDVARLRELVEASPELVNAKDNDGETPLHMAAMMGRMEAVLYLMEKGADIEARNSINQSPLLYAAYRGFAPIVDTLITRGAQFDYRDTRGYAPIHFAARQGSEDVVKLLVDKGAPFDERGYQGRTPLHFAAANGHTGIVQFLAARGAKLDTSDDSGQTPIVSALRDGKIATAEFLLDAGLVIEGGEEALTRFARLSAAAGSQRMVDVLVSRGASLDGADENGRTLLHHAAIGDLTGLTKTMIARAPNTDAVDGVGRTALHYAVSRNRGEIVDMLLAAGADPNVVDADGRTPLHIAEDLKRDDIAQTLRTKGAREIERRVYRLARAGHGAKGGGADRIPLEIAYIANEGFLISRGEKKVLIDALHASPWNYTATGERIFSMVLEGLPPFDGVDLSVASHAHADHMSPRMNAELLVRDPDVVFVSSPTARDSIRIVAGDDFARISERVVAVDPEWKETATLELKGINVAFFGVNHAGPDQTPYKTLATVLDLDGIRLAHLADQAPMTNVENYRAADLTGKGVDIIFADRFFLADSVGQYIMREYMKPEHIILMHSRESEFDAAAEQLLPLYPNLHIYRDQLERRRFGF